MNCIVFDTEDNSQELMLSGRSGFDKHVTQICARSSTGQSFYNKGAIGQFLDWLYKSDCDTFIAHNLQYDLGNLFGDSLDHLDVTLVGGRLIKARWHDKVFLDSFNLWPMALKKVGKAFNLEKKDLDANSKDYVERDVEILFRAIHFVVQFCDEQKIERFPATLGSLALDLWQQISNYEPVHDSLYISRESLYGGRVELFAKGGYGNFHYVDVNSLYPACMLEDFPADMLPMSSIDDGLGVARVKVKVPDCYIAPLPFRNLYGRIFYPTGTFQGVWTFSELRKAQQLGAKVLKVFEAYGSKQTVKPYSSYVGLCWDKRQKAQSEAENLFWKLLLNNLYGRLGFSGKITRS